MNKEFAELLKGCRPVKDDEGNIIVQSIMNMQIVCLETDSEYSLDSRFANPLTSLIANNSSYGQISFTNNENKEVILPAQMAVMTKQQAQNHGMVKGAFINKNTNVTFHDAGCVQGGQTGYFRGTQEFRAIPITMREMLFDKVGQTSGHGNIYPAIQKLGVDTQSNTGNYLNMYFDKYDKQLEQFIAHFERPSRLIGVIILVDGEIVAIDKFPSYTYAEQVWDVMIRDCYGALAIISQLKQKTSTQEFTATYAEMKKNHQGSVIELFEQSLKRTKQKMTANVHEKIQEVLELSFDAKLDTEGNPVGNNLPKSYVLSTDGYIGQVICESDFNHLVSLIKRENFNPNALRVANELRRKAKKQQRFTL